MVSSVLKKIGLFAAVAMMIVALCGLGVWIKGPPSTLTTIVKLSDSQDATLTGDRLTVLFDEVSGTDNGFSLEQACILHNVKYLDIVLINPGGNVFVMLDYLDTIDRLKTRGIYVTTYARGLIASAAVPIFVSGDRRVITEHTWVMIHPGSWRNDRMGNWPEAYDHLFYTFEKWYSRFISDRTNLSYEAVLSIMQRSDTELGAIYWTADVALALGIATEIEGFNSWNSTEPPDKTGADISQARQHAKDQYGRRVEDLYVPPAPAPLEGVAYGRR